MRRVPCLQLQHKNCLVRTEIGMKKKTVFSVLVFALTSGGCTAQPVQPPLAEATCQARSCKIKVDASACETGGRPSVDIGTIHIKGNQNIQIVWEVQHARYEFRLGRSLLLKNPRGDPTGQFSGNSCWAKTINRIRVSKEARGCSGSTRISSSTTTSIRIT